MAKGKDHYNILEEVMERKRQKGTAVLSFRVPHSLKQKLEDFCRSKKIYMTDFIVLSLKHSLRNVKRGG